MRARSAARTTVLSSIAVLAGFAMACGPPAEGPATRLTGALTTDRFQFTGDSLDALFRWEFGEGNDLQRWTILADRLAEQRGDHLLLAGSERVSLVRGVSFDAGNVDRIVVRQEGLGTGVTRVYWSRRGERFSADRQVSLTARDGTDNVYEFPVGEHPEWTGRIQNFRFDATSTAGEEIALESISSARTGADVPGGMYRRSWGFEFDGELRSGILVSSDQPQVRSATHGENARLYFATALVVPPDAGTARFSVTRIEGDRELELYEHIARGEQDSRWTPAAVPLAGHGNAELRFAIECPESDNCAGTFASIETRSGGPPERPSVVLISIDTLRADRMSLYGHDRPTTPRIDRWAESTGVTFERAVSASPWTLPSHTSMLTGLDPTTHNVNYDSTIPEAIELLPERLHADGYVTAAITGGGFVSPQFGFRQGFDIYAYSQQGVNRYRSNPADFEFEIASGLQRASTLLDELDERPFFLFFHTYEVHAPYRARLPYFESFYGAAPDPANAFVTTPPDEQTASDDYKVKRRFTLNVPGDDATTLPAEDISLARAMYDSGVAFTDAYIGKLFDELEARGLLQNTIVVLTSDHGEMLGEMGLAGHVYVHEENVRVPLVISWPARFAGGTRTDRLARTVDITPTLLEMLGHDVPEGLDGISLVPHIEARTTAPEPNALTYAASSNHGLAVRLPDDLVYLYDNTLWRSGRADRLVPIDRGTDAADPNLADRADRLLLDVEMLLERRRGLHLALANSEGEGEFTVKLRGPGIKLNKLKATRLTCPCASWIPDRGTAELRLPAGEEFAVQVEDASGSGPLFIDVYDGEQVFTTTVRLGDLEEALAIERTVEGWARRNLDDTEVTRGLVVWWNGGIGGVEDAVLNEETIRRLRALGYLR